MVINKVSKYGYKVSKYSFLLVVILELDSMISPLQWLDSEKQILYWYFKNTKFKSFKNTKSKSMHIKPQKKNVNLVKKEGKLILKIIWIVFGVIL